jgi:hypothetical protein
MDPILLEELEISGPSEAFVPTPFGIISEGRVILAVVRSKIQHVWTGIWFNWETSLEAADGKVKPVEGTLGLFYSSVGPTRGFPIDPEGKLLEESAGVVAGLGQVSLFQNKVQGNNLGIGVWDNWAILFGNEAVDNVAGIGLHLLTEGGQKGFSVMGNRIAHNSEVGLYATPDAVEALILCQGNNFEGNGRDIAIDSYPEDPEALAELARRCGVELED